MFPWRRVLIPTDFSTAARWAFDNAIHVAGSTGAELLVVHVRMTRTSQPAELRFPADQSVYDYAEQYELEALRDRARQLNASVSTKLIVRQAPDPGNEIARVAASEGVDLVVIATHARHHVAHLIIGSTTMAVLENPPAPVLAVRYGTKRRRAMRKIVVPLRPQETSSDALTLATAIAAHVGGEVLPITIEGDNAERAIVKYAERMDADVIAVHATIGEMKLEIIRSAETPILIVPPAA